jgi:hypothetical protein
VATYEYLLQAHDVELLFQQRLGNGGSALLIERALAQPLRHHEDVPSQDRQARPRAAGVEGRGGRMSDGQNALARASQRAARRGRAGDEPSA